MTPDLLRWRRRAGWSLRLLLACPLAVTFKATPAWATGVVGTGTPASCTETALNTALSGGGLVTFNCGPNPKAILITTQKVIAADTTVDGGGLISLSGGNSTRLFFIGLGRTLTLTALVLENGNPGNDSGGAVYNSGGTLILDNSTIQDSHTGGPAGGAIFGNGGTITLTNSLVQGNDGYDYGAINTTGALYLVNSVIRHNTAAQGGGALSVGGPVTIDHSQIYNNTTSGAAGGGAIYITASGQVTVIDSQIYSNTAPNSSATGGGFYNAGTLTLTNVTLSGNSASGSGGGIFNDGTATFTNVTLSGNLATVLGGGIDNNSGSATLTNVTLSSNSAIRGGGLNNNDGTLTLTNVTLSSNSATDGGGIDNGGGIFNDGTATLTNVTLSGNAASDFGGGINDSGTATLTNVTLSGNSALYGGGIHFVTIHMANSLSLKNTLVANSPTGGNCYVDPGSVHGVSSNGFNLSSDTSCADFIQAGDRNNQPALLFPLANNGGPTLTHLPRHDSPAIDNGTGAGCPATDQRGQPRPQGAACDIGAVEVQPGDLVWPLYLSFVRR